MQFQYLGTAAAEGWPAVFCRCKYCLEAQRLGGKNIRTRSQAIVNDDLLLDLPPDTYMHKLMNNLDLSRVKYLFVTHFHMDHFYPQELTVRGSVYSLEMISPELEIYCAQETYDYFRRCADWEIDEKSDSAMHWHILKPFETVEAGPYRVTPLPANHMTPRTSRSCTTLSIHARINLSSICTTAATIFQRCGITSRRRKSPPIFSASTLRSAMKTAALKARTWARRRSSASRRNSKRSVLLTNTRTA